MTDLVDRAFQKPAQEAEKAAQPQEQNLKKTWIFYILSYIKFLIAAKCKNFTIRFRMQIKIHIFSHK